MKVSIKQEEVYPYPKIVRRTTGWHDIHMDIPRWICLWAWITTKSLVYLTRKLESLPNSDYYTSGSFPDRLDKGMVTWKQ